MGTRSLTFVYDEHNEAIINLYRQYNGYPELHGRELANFLLPRIIVNDIQDETDDIANGMSCLAVQLIAHFSTSRKGAGFHIHSVSDRDCGQDYEYHVHKDRVVVKHYCERVGLLARQRELFSGDWENFSRYCTACAGWHRGRRTEHADRSEALDK